MKSLEDPQGGSRYSKVQSGAPGPVLPSDGASPATPWATAGRHSPPKDSRSRSATREREHRPRLGGSSVVTVPAVCGGLRNVHPGEGQRGGEGPWATGCHHASLQPRQGAQGPRLGGSAVSCGSSAPDPKVDREQESRRGRCLASLGGCRRRRGRPSRPDEVYYAHCIWNATTDTAWSAGRRPGAPALPPEGRRGAAEDLQEKS